MTPERRGIDIEGLVQGVGFRPFVSRLAQQMGLDGWVANNPHGVRIEVEGQADTLHDFIERLQRQKPEPARIEQLTCTLLTPNGRRGFHIEPSVGGGDSNTTLLPDLAPCPQCTAELFDPGNRRYHYPFINCSHCGPRYSIAQRLPYDRANTSMAQFPLCDACAQEYRNSNDRRYHAEAIACADCGPTLAMLDADGRHLSGRVGALELAAGALFQGNILALKSVGGFQLLVVAGNEAAVTRLRHRKRRPAKPLALLYPNLESVLLDCEASAAERALLAGPERPILLLARKPVPSGQVAASVAPGSGCLGVMLPSSPLHLLLMARLQQPLVATSGNLAQEPLCFDNAEAITRLADLADLYLVHDRAIVRPLDDSVVRFMDDQPVPLRRARGYAPLPVLLPPEPEAPTTMLAVGGQLKNSIALGTGNRAHLSQHLGDLDSRIGSDGFAQAIDDLRHYHDAAPALSVHDLHPGYVSSRWADNHSSRRLAVQHHIAHFFACMAEHGHRGPAFGVTWDGSGYGDSSSPVNGDNLGTVLRGGECLSWDGKGAVRHAATLRPFPLPGAEQAIREPRRQALGLIYALGGEPAFARAPALLRQFKARDCSNLARMLESRLNSPTCTSIGRLFDAVAALLGLASVSSFEGEAAMALETAARRSDCGDHYPLTWRLDGTGTAIVDWQPLVEALLTDIDQGKPVPTMAARFHNSLAQSIVTGARQAGTLDVFLSGGVFQNRRLTETAARLLRARGFRVHLHRRVPPNDGGLALGQIYYARVMARYTLAGAQPCA